MCQWCYLTLTWRFWVTKVCLWLSKTSKICLFSYPNGGATFWKANFENFSRYSLIKLINGINSYQYNIAWAILFNNTINRPKGCNFIKEEILAQMFFWEFSKISRNYFFIETHLSTAFGLSFTFGNCFWIKFYKSEKEGTSLVKFLQSCHFNIKWRKYQIKRKDQKQPLEMFY